MFERYSEQAKRVIFWARKEASTFGSTTIETELLLLGLIREDENLIRRFLRDGSVEAVRQAVQQSIAIREKVPESIDLPLSEECTRILTQAAKESERLNHPQIGTEDLLLGILLEEKCLASKILTARGLRLRAVRVSLAR